MMTTNWKAMSLETAPEQLRRAFGFDFTAIGLSTEEGGPLRWVYVSGATNAQYKRIVLSPGSGIGGITLKNGCPMMVRNIDEEIDPREYSSYPIVFAEDLLSFCALPLMKGPLVKAVLLCAFRSVNPGHEKMFRAMAQEVSSGLCAHSVRSFEPSERYGYGSAGSAGQRDEAAESGLDPYKVLSNRKLQVFRLLAQGYTNKEIAEQIFVSVKTVETHRSKIYSKLGIKTRAELVRCAINHHLMDI